MELVLHIGLIEKGDIQRAGLVHSPQLHQLQALADTAESRRGGYHNFHAGGILRLEVPNLLILPPVVIGPGKIADKVPERADVQLRQGFCPLLSNPLDIADISTQIQHGQRPSLSLTPRPAATAGVQNPRLPGPARFPAGCGRRTDW